MPPLGSLFRGAARLGLGGAGAHYGYTSAEDEEDRLLRSLGFGALGGVVGPAALRSAGLFGGPQPKMLSERLANFTYFSMLSSPDTIVRANAGALGGAVTGAVERILDGAARGDWKTIKQGGNIIGSLVKDAPKTYFKGITANPTQFDQMYKETMGQTLAEATAELHGMVGTSGGKEIGAGISKLFSVPDLVAVKAMRKGGFSADEARRYTLAGEPTSYMGSKLLSLQRGARSRGGFQAVLATQLAPFARVGLMGIEKGVQRTPGLGIFAGGPGTKLQKGIQQGMGAGLFGVGYKSEDWADPRWSLVGGTAAGPGFLPFTIGREFRKAQESGRGLGNIGLETFQEFSPLGFRPGEVLSWRGLQRRAIPAGVADIAAAVDPAFGRESSNEAIRASILQGETPSWVGGPQQFPMNIAPAVSAVPGLRTVLPQQFAPVDVFGRPRYETPQAPVPWGGDKPLMQGLLRTLAPSREAIQPTAAPMSNPVFARLRELGINLQPPTSSVSLPGVGLPLTQTARSAAAVQRLGGQGTEIAAPIVDQIMKQPQFLAMDPARRNMIARLLMGQIRSALGGAFGQARLATALGQGAGLPRQLTT